MKIIAVIPARYASTRFPAKLMQDLGGKTVILRTYEAAINTQLFDYVFVVTDSDLIYDEIVSPQLAPNVIKLRNNPYDCVIPTKEEFLQTYATNRDSSFVGMANKRLT